MASGDEVWYPFLQGQVVDPGALAVALEITS